jgi:hypothetical protein
MQPYGYLSYICNHLVTYQNFIKMTTRKVVLATIIGGIALFFSDGAFQAIPNFGVRAVERMENANLTTPEFAKIAHPMAYIVTNQTVSFTATQPAQFYNLGKFFTIEFLSALLISFIFALIFSKMANISLKNRVYLTILFAFAASTAIHFSYFNWWGFSAAYTIGVTLKTIFGWTLLAYIQNRFIFKIA